MHLEKNFHASTLGLETSKRVNSDSLLKDVSSQQTIYGNSIQMEDYPQSPVTLRMVDYANFSLYSELSEGDDSFAAFKSFSR
jgi:hypothetical protein